MFSGIGEPLEGRCVSTPFDLYSVEKLRDDHGLRKGSAFATDVFIFGHGPAPDRRLTKYSGLPYWPKNRPWPTVREGLRIGQPCEFLAQFCFLDSRDIARDLPGDILAIFVPPNDEGEWLFELEWVQFEWITPTPGEELVEQLPDGVRPYTPKEWYGVVHRTYDYPDAVAAAKELKVQRHWDLPVLHGTKIGGLPRTVNFGAPYTVDPTTGLPSVVEEFGPEQSGTFLCQLASLQPTFNLPYPWTNEPAPIDSDDDEQCRANQILFADAASVFIYLTSTGEVLSQADF